MNDLFGDNNNWSWCLQNLDDVIKTHGAPCRAWVTPLNVDDIISTHGALCRAWVNLTPSLGMHDVIVNGKHLCGTAALFQDDTINRKTRKYMCNSDDKIFGEIFP
mgnify:FL=1